jgi:isocitrate lyase
MTLLHLFLAHRYGAASVHYLTPTDDNRHQCARMLELGLFSAVRDEVGEIIVAEIDVETVRRLVATDGSALDDLIARA